VSKARDTVDPPVEEHEPAPEFAVALARRLSLRSKVYVRVTHGALNGSEMSTPVEALVRSLTVVSRPALS
jgi:hypothetical protein